MLFHYGGESLHFGILDGLKVKKTSNGAAMG